jgi:hypothetical protein
MPSVGRLDRIGSRWPAIDPKSVVVDFKIQNLPQIALAHLDLAQAIGRRRTEMQRIGLHLDANNEALNQVLGPGYEAT